MAKQQFVKVIDRSIGLNAKYDPAGIALADGKNSPLTEAVNCVVSDLGEVERRYGFETLSALGGKSIFAGKTRTYFVTSAGTLYCASHIPFLAGSFTEVKTGLADERMSFVEVGNVVYCCNGVEKGKILGDAWTEWESATYVGERVPTKEVIEDVELMQPRSYEEGTNEDTTSTVMIPPPIGERLCYYRGRIYISKGNFVHFTEAFWLDWYAPVYNYKTFPATVLDIVAVDDGIFVCTEEGIFFLSGVEPFSMEMSKVSSAVVMKGMGVNVEASKIGNGEMFGTSGLIMSDVGLLWLQNGGRVFNLMRDKLDSPIVGVSGCATIFDGQYIGMIDP